VGDRVLQTRNNLRLGVVNGDVGLLTAIDAGVVTADYGDGRVVAYAPADLLDLEHAYAITVHKSQGGEWPGVVLLIAADHGPLLTRNLLYTGLTRAKRAAVIIGEAAAIARAVANTRDQERRTGLRALLTPEAGPPR
jgi:exodeoxyribonuclease V alpha subunit